MTFREFLQRLLDYFMAPKASYTFQAFTKNWLTVWGINPDTATSLFLRGDGFIMLDLKEAQKWRTYRVSADVRVQYGPPANYHSWGIGILVQKQGRNCGGRYQHTPALDFVMCEVWAQALKLRGPAKDQPTRDDNYHVANPCKVYAEAPNRGVAGDFHVEIEVAERDITFTVGGQGGQGGQGGKSYTAKMRRSSGAADTGSIALHGNDMYISVQMLQVDPL